MNSIHLLIISFTIFCSVIDGLQINSALSARLQNSTHRKDTKLFNSIGWDSHQAVESIPETLVRTIDGNESMRSRFELLCRTAQVSNNY